MLHLHLAAGAGGSSRRTYSGRSWPRYCTFFRAVTDSKPGCTNSCRLEASPCLRAAALADGAGRFPSPVRPDGDVNAMEVNSNGVQT